jgi:ribonuclease R
MPQVFKNRILKFLRHEDYRPLKLPQLARALGVSDDAHEEFQTAFEALRRAGHVVIGGGNLITLPSMAGQVVGHFRANPKGFGFVSPLEPNAHGDLFIPPDSAGDAMTGDVVLAKVNRKGRRGAEVRYTGEIVEVLERANNRFVGTLTRHPEAWLVQPDGTTFIEPIVVEDISAKNAREKDKVVVELLSYPSEKYLARGVIVEVLGRAGQYATEIASIVHQYHLPGEFDEACLEQARLAAAQFKPPHAGGREDLCDKVIVTIDPPDAKDFDDAISLETDAQGNRVLGVHIADFTKSVFLTYDEDGKVLSRRFANTLIRSTARLTYEQADRILKGHTKGTKRPVINLLRAMEALSLRVEARRTAEGMLHLDLPEPELVFDGAGRVVDAHPADTSYPHTIIEMFMVEANEAVASILDRHNIPTMRRVHPDPNALSLMNMARLLRAMGIPAPKSPDRRAIQSILDFVKGTERSLAVNLVVLRSLERAVYAPSHIGHFALASKHYCHFTSPIRRYADLLVHRMLQYCLEDRIEAAKQAVAGQDLFAVGTHLTFTEERADDAEQELKTVLMLQMLSKKLGEELACVVTGLTGFGIFVQSEKFGIEGLIKFEDLGPDHWQLNKVAQCVVGEHSGESIHLGQPMHVRIVSVNIPARQLNLAPVEPLGQARRPVRTGKAGRKGKRKARR